MSSLPGRTPISIGGITDEMIRLFNRRPRITESDANAVIDALGGTGVRNIDMPLLPDRVWEAITYRRDVSGAPPVRADD